MTLDRRIILIILLFAPFLLRSENACGQPRQRQPVPEAPFELIQNQVVVQVKVAGKGPFSMLVDTGTDLSVIDSAMAREVGLATGRPVFEIGNLTVKDLTAGTLDLAKQSERLGRPIHGVLGYSFMKDRIIQIDYPASKIRFYPETPHPGILNAPNTVNRIGVTFRYDEGVIIDSVFINSQKMKAILDTGSNEMFALTPEAAAMLGVEPDEDKGSQSGGDGVKENAMVLLKSIRLGRLALDSEPATLLPTSTAQNKKFQVRIGNDFFKDFIMTFDFRGKIVVFERVD